MLVLGSALCAQAQVASPAAAAAPSFRQPQLVEGGGDAALVQAIQRQVVYPRRALRDNMQGTSQVSFAVAPDGSVCQVKMLSGIRADLDTAVVQAVRKLPRLQPAVQFGRPVACLMRAPVTFFITNASRPPRHPRPATDSTQVYTAVSWMPRYKDVVNYRELANDLAIEYLRLGQPTGCPIPRMGTQMALTVGPHGKLYNLQLVKNDEAEQVALRAQFGDEIAQPEVGLETEFPEACLPQLVEAVSHLPRLMPAYVNGQPVAMRLVLPLFNHVQ